jgi:hypothetical protein
MIFISRMKETEHFMRYLKSKGVFVLRMDAFKMNEMKDIELENWIMSGLESIGSELSTR